MKRTTIFLPEIQIKLVKKLVSKKGLKFSELIRRAIDLLLISENAR